jgi:OOP family OmpA-OmpF porin
MDKARDRSAAGTLAVTALAIVLAGCAGGPKPNPDLTAARASYDLAERSPEVANRAPDELAEAGATLRRAERAWREDKDEKTTDLSQLAEQEVSLARVEAQLREYRARETSRGMLLTLRDVLFRTGSAELRPGALADLEPLVTFLQAHPGYEVRVAGYTDNTGGARYNRQLSAARAAAVKRYLIERGVSPGRIVSYGYGERNPIASNATALGRQENRRVELVVSRGSSPRVESTVVIPSS